MRDAVPDGRSIGQHLAAAFQRLLFPGGQRGIFDLLHLIAQQVDTALFFTLVRNLSVQFPLDLDQLPINGIILLILGTILGIGVQNSLVVGRVQQSNGIVLAVDVDEPAAQLPQDRCGGRHPVDAAGALALSGDLTAQEQCFRALIPGFFQTVQHSRRNIFKCRPDHRLCSTGTHQIFGGTVAKNGVDGIHENGFARARLAREDVETFFKMDIGLLDDGHIFNLQAA